MRWKFDEILPTYYIVQIAMARSMRVPCLHMNNTHCNTVLYCVVIIIIKITIVVLRRRYVYCIADRHVLNGIDDEPNNV